MTRLTKQQIADNEAAEQQAAQQAELKRLRAAKAAATRAANKATLEKLKASAEHAVAGVAATFDPVDEDAARRAKISAAWDTLMDNVGGIDLPSWKRSTCAFILALAAAAGVGYVAGQIASVLMIASIAVTGTIWAAYIIMALGMLLAAWAGGKAAQVVFGYIAEARIDDHYAAAKRRVSGWFKRDEVAQFTGAYAS